MAKRKGKRVPSISKDRADTTSSSKTVGNTKEDRRAHAFIKDKEPTQAITLRLPVKLHRKLRQVAFKAETKMTPIILQAIKEYLRK